MYTEDKATDAEDVEDATVTPGEDDEMVELSDNVVTVESEAVVDDEADAVVADEDVVAAAADAVEAATDADAMLALATTEEYCCISITAASSNT